MNRKSYGLLARFETPKCLLIAATKVRNSGYSKFDCHTPYPMHGLDDAMGLKRSILGFVVGGGALGGAFLGLLLQWFASSYDYPIVISGKPYFSWQAYMIITFVTMVLGGALSALGGMFHLNRMPTYHHPLFNSETFKKATDDGFFISIESDDVLYDEKETSIFLKSIGSVEVEVVNV
tara:strand:+ start:3115 stop:3648 length:534 start_codon:yes stop_codon:yes gene_type:complete